MRVRLLPSPFYQCPSSSSDPFLSVSLSSSSESHRVCSTDNTWTRIHGHTHTHTQHTHTQHTHHTCAPATHVHMHLQIQGWMRQWRRMLWRLCVAYRIWARW